MPTPNPHLPDPTVGRRTTRPRLTPLAALLLPATLAVVSLAPVLLVEAVDDLPAYASRGYLSHSTDYWYPPVAFDDRIELKRWNQDLLTIATTREAAFMGAPFAGDSWTFTMDFVRPVAGPGGDAVLAFTDSRADRPYLRPIEGLRVMPGHDAAGAPTLARVVAVGTRPPYRVAPLRSSGSRISISSSWGAASVRLDGALVWAGDPGWRDFAGAFPILHLGPGEYRVSAVPTVDASFAVAEPADPVAFRAAFAETALRAQDGTGLFSSSTRTDSWTALALVLEHRKTADARIAEALDRWAEARVAATAAGRSWPGAPGTSSIRENVGEPGIPLALWAKDRGREDWSAAVANMIEAAGFTDCVGSGLDWCRLGNLQPDGRVIRAGEPGATDLLVNFQFAETAGFVVGADLSSRRDWIRAFGERTYKRLCQMVETLGQNRRETDAQPWSPDARTGHPAVMFLIGLAYAERPDDSVWSEASVRRLLTCGMQLLDTQVGGPMGWRTEKLERDTAIGAQDVAASRLLQPLTSVVLDRERFDVAWERLIDRGTLRARSGPNEAPDLADYRTAVAAVMLELVEP